MLTKSVDIKELRDTHYFTCSLSGKFPIKGKMYVDVQKNLTYCEEVVEDEKYKDSLSDILLVVPTNSLMKEARKGK